jgi:hypothetical protein
VARSRIPLFHHPTHYPICSSEERMGPHQMQGVIPADQSKFVGSQHFCSAETTSFLRIATRKASDFLYMDIGWARA